MDNKSLKQLGDLIDKKLKPIKKQLGSVDTRLGSVETKLGTVDKRFDSVDKRLGTIGKKLDTLEMKIEVVNQALSKKIEKTQEETIEAISELIHSRYNNHEKRIGKIEDHLQLPQVT